MEQRKRLCVRVNEACEMLSISRTTLFKLDIPHVKINNIRLYKIKDLEEYIEAHTKCREVTA